MQRSRGGNTPVPGEMKGDLTIANGIAGVQIWGYSAYHDVGDLKPHEFRYSGKHKNNPQRRNKLYAAFPQ